MSTQFQPITGGFSATEQQVDWSVRSLRGHEGVNDLYHFDIVVAARSRQLAAALDIAEADAAAVEAALVGQRLCFRLNDSASATDRWGLIAAVTAEGTRAEGGEGYLQLRLEVVPRAWLLSQRVDSRVFQGLYMHEIVSQILCQHGVQHRWSLNLKKYPRRIYCTQYQETDLDFVRRLLAEEGVMFFFEHRDDNEQGEPPTREVRTALDDRHWLEDVGGAVGGALGGVAGIVGDISRDEPFDPDADHRCTPGEGHAGPGGDGEVLVFVDQAGDGYGPRERTSMTRLDFRPEAGMVVDETQVGELSRCERLRADQVVLRDYDYRRPLLELKGEAAREEAGAHVGAPLEIYDHHGEYNIPDVDDAKAAIELEQHRAAAVTLSARSASPLLLAGHRFSLDGVGELTVVRALHEWVEAGAEPGQGELLPVHVHFQQSEAARHEHGLLSEGGQQTYQTVFECVHAEVPYRPPRPGRRTRNVLESATVVGPIRDEEHADIYTDKFGRIKVQFHWDRHGELDEKSSCWIRVMHPWAGAGWGFQYIPRVGMEVLVSFLGGDPDRPVVIGSVYNQTHPMPEQLPAKKTRSGFRSQTTPEGGGFSELMFDDAKGQERVYLRSQHDLVEEVNHNHALGVRNEQAVTVTGFQRVAVGEQQLGVKGDRSMSVGRHQRATYGGNRSERVEQNDVHDVLGNTIRQVGGNSIEAVRADEVRYVVGDQSVTVCGDATLQIGGADDKQSSQATTFVQGSYHVTATERVVIRSEQVEGEAGAALRLQCGETYIELDGKSITLSAEKVVVRGSETTQVIGASGELLMGGGSSRLRDAEVSQQSTAGGRLQLDANAKLKGAQISLSSPPAPGAPKAADEPTKPEGEIALKFTHLQLHKGEPIANTQYRVLVGGLVHEGQTSDSGELSFFAPAEAESAQVTLWANESYSAIYPRHDGPLQWLVSLVEEMPPPDDPEGARLRLQNLGYDPGSAAEELAGAEDTAPVLHPATRDALARFQHDDPDDKLRETGDIEDDTAKRLAEISGS